MSEPDAAIPGVPVWRIIAGRLVPFVGAIVCTIGCVGSPMVIATLTAAGIGFLRTDWLLIPLDALSIALVIRGFGRARILRRRGQQLT